MKNPRTISLQLEQLCHQHEQVAPRRKNFLLRLPELLTALQISRASVYAKMKLGGKYFDPTFPRPITLSPSGRGGVAWLAHEVEAWLQQQVEKRDSALSNVDVAPNSNLSSPSAAKSAYRFFRAPPRDTDVFLPDIHSTRNASAINN